MSNLLVDSFGRETTDIRISLTDRCNFDCFYCHNEGLGDTRGPREPQDNEMSTQKVLRIARIAHEFGIKNFKLTGGEPMLRKDLEVIVDGIADLEGTEVSMTTNGTFLPGRAQELKDNGLERVNVSMDTNNPEEFREITRGGIKRVYEGIDAAIDAGLTPVKLNMVMAKPMRPHLEDMVDYVRENSNLRLQIIEYMPEIVGQDEYHVDIDEVKNWLAQRADEVKTREMHHRNRYIIDGSMVEVVDPVQNPEFCANCHRIRVTHDGKLKGCLNRNDDLIPTQDANDDEIRGKFKEVVDNRVPYYGEYMIKENGEWVKNPEYEQNDNPMELPLLNDD
ncbi:MAG: GTP 3',8-cyclase MoaA [Halobacteria archaeon]|nr:GTP 3',8-cyclase MoaA [Halobacteria archaeon]